MPNHRTNFACSVDGCKTPAYTRQLCRSHYSRAWRHGDPQAGGPRKGLPLAERLAQYTERTDGCWLWVGAKDRQGYGRLSINQRPELAHRITFEIFRGAIPDGLELDHLCRTPACVRPEHLEPVTHAENMRRGADARRAEAA